MPCQLISRAGACCAGSALRTAAAAEAPHKLGLADLTRDGRAETTVFDTVGDGKADSLDTTGDGEIDTQVTLLPSCSLGSVYPRASSDPLHWEPCVRRHISYRAGAQLVPLDIYRDSPLRYMGYANEVSVTWHWAHRAACAGPVV